MLSGPWMIDNDVLLFIINHVYDASSVIAIKVVPRNLMIISCSLYISVELSTILNFERVFRTKPNISKTSGTFVPYCFKKISRQCLLIFWDSLTHTKHGLDKKINICLIN